MALEGVGEKALVLSTSDNAKIVKPKKKVLDEDTYTEVWLGVDGRVSCSTNMLLFIFGVLLGFHEPIRILFA